VIVRLEAEGAVVADADDLSAVHVETTLAPEALRTALLRTGTGTPDLDSTGVVLDIGVLRSRARLLATVPDWPERFDAMIAAAGHRLTGDGLGLRVPVDRPS
jgi:hypothetical protein